MIFEIIWMRMLSLVLGGTHAAITAVLASFVLGMAVGGLWGGRFVDQRQRPLKAFGVIQILIAFSVMGLPYLFSHINDFLLFIPGYFTEQKFLFRFIVNILILFIPSFLTGATFPVLLKYFTTGIPMVGRNAGQLYFVNTLGAILGVTITGFFLIETFGLQYTLYFGVALSATVGACALTLDYNHRHLTPYKVRGKLSSIKGNLIELRKQIPLTPFAKGGTSCKSPFTKGEKSCNSSFNKGGNIVSPPLIKGDLGGFVLQFLKTKRFKSPNLMILGLAPLEGIKRGIIGLFLFFWHSVGSLLTGLGEGDKTKIPVGLITGTAVFISGFTFFAYEIVWTRVFSLIFPTTTYAFSLMLISFLTGITSGSWIYYKFLSHRRNNRRIFGFVELGIGTAMLFLISFFGYVYIIFDRFSLHFEGDWLKLTLFKFVFMFLTLLIPATLMGMAFPVLHKLFIREKAIIGKSSGILYFFNSLGAVFGIVLTGFMMIPFLGIKKGVIALAFTNIILGIVFCVDYLKRQNWVKNSLFGCGIFTLSLIPVLSQNDLTTDLFKYYFKEDGKLVYFNEGSENTVVIAETPKGDRYLIANFNEYVGDTSKISANSQKKQGHLPLLLHPNPQNVLFIGFGTGITLGAAGLHNNIEKIDCVEISENVVEASRYFSEWNNFILKKPGVHLFVEDGRNYLQTTNERYDVIVSEVYKAENSGIVNLYTREFFDNARDKLTSSGIFCQWISLRDLPEAAFKGLIKTFAESFSNVSLWSGSPGIVGLVGYDYKLSLNMNQLTQSFGDPQIKELYSGDVFNFLCSFVTEKKEVLKYAGNARIITDNKPYLEFTIPRTLQYVDFEDNLSRTLFHIAGLIKPPINLLDFHNIEGEKLDHIKEKLRAYSQAKRHFLLGNSFFWAGDKESGRKEYRKGVIVHRKAVKSTKF